MCNYLCLKFSSDDAALLNIPKIEREEGVRAIHECFGKFHLLVESDGVDPEKLAQKLKEEIPEIIETKVLRDH